MASFSDNFDRSNESVEAGSWTALDGADDTSAVATISATKLISASLSQRVVCWRSTDLPTDIPQECKAAIVSSAQGSNYYVDVGVMGKADTSGLSTLPLGLWARFEWLASGARRVSLMRFLPSDSAQSTVADVDLVLAGSVVAEGWENRLQQDGALGVPQIMRIVVTVASPYGLRARVFLNNEDEDRPVIDQRISHDFVGTGDAAQEFGHWWVGFGPSTAAGPAILGVIGADYTTDEGKVDQEQRGDQPTLGEVRDLIKRRYQRSTRGALDDVDVDTAIIDTLRDLRAQIGDTAWFLVRSADVSLTVDGNNYTCTLPSYMERVLRIADGTYDVPVWWEFLYLTTSGAQVVRINGLSGTYTVKYSMRWTEPVESADTVPIPRLYRETIVCGACMRLAQSEGRADILNSFMVLYANGLKNMQRDQARQSNAQMARVQPATVPFAYLRSWPRV